MSDSRSRLTLPAAAVLAGLLVAVGAWLLWHSSRPTTVGWFAYSPLSETVYAPGGLTTADWAGLALVGVGLLALGAVGGYALGRRRRP